VSVHVVVLGPVDTDKNRGFNIPKVSTESAAAGIFDGSEKAKRRFSPIPRPNPSRRLGALAQAELERQFAAFAPQTVANAG